MSSNDHPEDQAQPQERVGAPNVDPPKRVIDKAAFKQARLCTIIAIVTAAVVGLPAAMMYDKHNPSNAFFALKLVQPPKFDAVVVGDSRVVYGVDPKEFKPIKAYNFGFFGWNLEPEAIEAAKKLVNPDSKYKVLAIGISRPALTDQEGQSNAFIRAKDCTPLDFANLKVFGKFDKYLTLDSSIFGGKDKGGKAQEFSNGFAAKTGVKALDGMTKRDEKNAKDKKTWVGDNMIDKLVASVREANIDGFKVMVFRVPTSQRMFEVETTKLHLDLARIKSRVEEAGGIWIDTPPYRQDLNSYDGSHLDAPSARTFSKELAASIETALSRN